MFRFKLFLLIALLTSSFSWAQEEGGHGLTTSANTGPTTFRTLAISYLSWTEMVDLTSGATTDKSDANFFGLGFTWAYEKYHRRWGSEFEISGLSGQANAGSGPAAAVPYQANYRSWFGVEAGYRLSYRLSPQINLEVGPFALVRQVSFPSDYNGTTVEVKSGSSFNYGATANLNYRLTPRWEVRQMIGTMAVKASTIWAMGLGLKY